MIRKFKKQDVMEVMKLWLDSNLQAHSFIEKDYWLCHYDTVKEMILNATMFVYEEDDVLYGFIGLMDSYIAGIFVTDKRRSKGIGTSLLNHVKRNHDVLTLHVYQENIRAYHFYKREGFKLIGEQIDPDTGHKEYVMNWSKDEEEGNDNNTDTDYN